MVVWGNTKYGHIAIADGDSKEDYFYSYDQNWNGKEMHRVKHNYNGVYGSLRPYAQDKVLGNNLTLENIIDLDLYNYMYEDLQKAFKGNKSKLLNHLYNYGIKEGRVFSYVYDPKYYQEKYADVKKVFGNDYLAILNHFLTYGTREGRQGSMTIWSTYYKDKNEQAIKDMTNADALRHFIKYGIKEWRATSPDFSVKVYKDSNPDLQKQFKNDCKAYYRHFTKYGIKEHRKYK